MKRLLALVLSASIGASGCASTLANQTTGGFQPTSRTALRVDPMLMADYIRQLPVGSRVRVSLADGSAISATLMKHDADPIVVQRRTRLPEPPIEITVRDILAVELESKSGNPARTAAIGAAAAAGATLSVLLILAAVFAD